jgi:hypothetical protein
MGWKTEDGTFGWTQENVNKKTELEISGLIQSRVHGRRGEEIRGKVYGVENDRISLKKKSERSDGG